MFTIISDWSSSIMLLAFVSGAIACAIRHWLTPTVRLAPVWVGVAVVLDLMACGGKTIIMIATLVAAWWCIRNLRPLARRVAVLRHRP